MRLISKLLTAGAVAAASLAVASQAGAVIVGVSAPFPDPKSAGADPLGDTFTTTLGGLSWQMAQQHFNVPAFTFGDGVTMATIFRFTLNNGVPKGISIDPAKTFFTDITTGKTWNAAFFDAGSNKNQRVEFTAPDGSAIFRNDLFKVRVGFVAPVDSNRYSWSASWDNNFAVPEPATWALMIGGFGLAGVALRRRQGAALAA